MARACPACGRPNADTAEKCLYCVTPFAPLETRERLASEAEAPLPPPLDETEADRHLLILIPGEPPGEAEVRELARITGVSLYDARLSLSPRRPRVFRRIDSGAEARRFSEELARARIPHYVTTETAVLSLPVAKCTGLEIQSRHLELRVEGSPPSTLSIPTSDVLLLVRGEIAKERHHDRRISSTRGATRRLTSGLRLHLYEKEASVAIEIEPETFDFRVLAADRTASALLNLEKLVLKLTAALPGVEIDRGFDLEPVVLSRSATAADVTDALSEAEHGPDGVLYDNEGSFRFYARWRYRLARHLSQRAPA